MTSDIHQKVNQNIGEIESYCLFVKLFLFFGIFYKKYCFVYIYNRYTNESI